MKTDITLGGLSMATVLTTVIDAIVLAATSNGIISIVLIPILMFFFIFLFCVRGVFKKITKVILTILMIVALVMCIKFGKVNKDLVQDGDDTTISQEEQNIQEEFNDETTNDETQEEGQEGSMCNCGCPYCCYGAKVDADKNAGTVTHKTGTSKAKKNPFGDEMTSSFAGGTANDKTTPTGQTKVEGSDTTKGGTTSNELPENQKKAIEEDKNNGKTAIEHDSGVITTSDDNTTNKKPDGGNQNPNLDTSNTEQASTSPETPTKTDTKPTEMNDEALKDYGNDTTTDKKDTETDKKEEKPENKVLTPVSIKAISENAISGDTIQFVIGGDVESISGYEGISVNDIKNGTLAINTPNGVTQTITINVVGKDGSKASASIIVKSIEDSIKDLNQDTKEPEKPVEEDKKDTESEQKPEVYTPVSVTVSTGDIYVGDSIQFYIKGDVKSLTGAGKTVNDIVSGVLTITAQEAGNITITVVGKDGSTDSKTVVVNNIPSIKPVEEAPAHQEEAPSTPSVDNTIPEEPKATPVSITAIGGSTATAGEVVKFQINGDVASISGTDGFATSNENGVLSVYTNEGEATVIDITVNGIDGSTATASVNVNCPV